MRRIALFALLSCTRQPAFDPVAASADGIVVMAFVTTECPISNRYAPTLQAIADRFGDVEFVAVYPDPDDDAQEVDDHRRSHGLRFRGVRDPDHALVRIVGATVTPEVAVYSDGAQVYRGRIDDRAVAFGNFRAASQHDDLLNAIEATLAGAPVEPARTEAIGCYIEDLR
jgi:thiol-disulfide isomerase/thioredoxin